MLAVLRTEEDRFVLSEYAWVCVAQKEGDKKREREREAALGFR